MEEKERKILFGRSLSQKRHGRPKGVRPFFLDGCPDQIRIMDGRSDVSRASQTPRKICSSRASRRKDDVRYNTCVKGTVAYHRRSNVSIISTTENQPTTMAKLTVVLAGKRNSNRCLFVCIEMMNY